MMHQNEAHSRSPGERTAPCERCERLKKALRRVLKYAKKIIVRQRGRDLLLRGLLIKTAETALHGGASRTIIVDGPRQGSSGDCFSSER